MARLPIVAAVAAYLVISCVGALAGESGGDEYFSATSEVRRLYGNTGRAELVRLHKKNADLYRDYGGVGFLYRQAAFAELAGLADEHEEALLYILEEHDYSARFLEYCIEALRGRGRLEANIDLVAGRVEGLEDAERTKAVRLLGGAFAWREPPGRVLELLRKEASGNIPLGALARLGRVLASWGHVEEAAEAVFARASAEGVSLGEQLDVAGVLTAMGATEAARRLAESAILKWYPRAPGGEVPLPQLFSIRQARLSRLVDIAEAAAAWDVLLERTALDGDVPDWRVMDRAAVLGARGMPIEEAEALDLLRRGEASGAADVLYGGVLGEIGDFFTARNLLLGAVAKDPSVSYDSYYDLVDVLLRLRDARTMRALAVVYSLRLAKPQTANTISQMLRILGDYEMSDRLFGSFVETSGIGPETRFNWQGARLWAVYYLDTGRLEEGRGAAFEAFEQLAGSERMRTNETYPAPKQFAELFERFGGLEYLVERCREHGGRYPESTLFLRTEQEALLGLGRWDEAVGVAEKLHEEADAVTLDLFLASANARAGRYEAAAEHYRAAIAADANVPAEAYMERALASAELGRWHDVGEAFLRGTSGSQARKWARLGQFFDMHGRTERASAAFGRLDDRALSVGGEHLGAAVRFWVKSGEVERAAAALARRVGAQHEFAQKGSYILGCLPERSSSAAGYMRLGEALRKGPLGEDAALLALFYRAVGRRAERLLEPATALGAYMEALALEKENPANALAICRLAAPEGGEVAQEAALSLVGKVSSGVAWLEVAAAEGSLGNRQAAAAALLAALDHPLDASGVGGVVDILESGALPPAVYERAVEKAGSWPWTMRARVVEAALDAGCREGALFELGELTEGACVVAGAIWAANTYARMGLDEEARAAVDAWTSLHGDHPALSVLSADLAVERGSPEEARRILIKSRNAFTTAPFDALYAAEMRGRAARGAAHRAR